MTPTPITAGIDPGIATMGWALADANGRVLDLGVSIHGRCVDFGVYDDMMRRLRIQCVELNAIIKRADRVQCESISWGVQGAIAKAYIAMSAAMVQALCIAHGKPLHFVSPQAWQQAVVPRREPVPKKQSKTDRKLAAKVRYGEIFNEIHTHVIRCGTQATTVLRRIKSADQNHAIDAAGLAVFGALNWEGY